jgi:hypothetical protein
MNFREFVADAFAELTPDLPSIYRDASPSVLGDWILKQQSLVTGSGALAVAIPGLHLVGMAADVAFLMNRMAVCSYGIGAIIGYDNRHGNILEKEDFAIVLARWSGDENLSDAVIAKACADVVGKVASKELMRILAKKMAEHAGVLVGKKLAGKAGTKIGAKFGAKLGAKVAAGWVPFFGAAVGGGVSLWFISEVASAAESWYRLKLALAQRAASPDTARATDAPPPSLPSRPSLAPPSHDTSPAHPPDGGPTPSLPAQTVGLAGAAIGTYYSAGRNAPCPCGSGKRFKHCHGQLS